MEPLRDNLSTMPEKVNLTIKATNTQLTPDVRRLVEQKFGGLAKFVRPHRDQEIRLAAEVGRKNKAQAKGSDSFFAELNIVAGGQRHRAVAAAPDLRIAIDQVKREMTAHLSRLHEKGKDSFEKGARIIKDVLHADLAPESELDAMVEEEAAKILATPSPTRRLRVTTGHVATKLKLKLKQKQKKKPAAESRKPAPKAATKGRKRGTKNTRGAKNRPPPPWRTGSPRVTRRRW